MSLNIVPLAIGAPQIILIVVVVLLRNLKTQVKTIQLIAKKKNKIFLRKNNKKPTLKVGFLLFYSYGFNN